MRCVSSKFFVGLLLAFCLLVLPSVSNAQCPQENCLAGHTIFINGVAHTTGNVLSLPINATANTLAFVGNGLCNTTRFAGNVAAAPFTGSFHTYGYSRQTFNYSPYFSHRQTGGAFTYRSGGFRRYR